MNNMIRIHSLVDGHNPLSLVRTPVLQGEKYVGFGVESLDGKLGGGLLRNALHEFFATSEDDSSAVSAFAAMLAMQAIGEQNSILWIREDRGVRKAGRLHAPGLAELGCDPDRVVLVTASDTLGLLRAGADSVKCGRIGAVVLEPWAQAVALDLTASRRLAMAAAASAVFTLVVRINAEPVPSAAQTRWQVAAAPSTALAANAPGHPPFDVALLRHRGGIAGFATRLEWNRDERCFALLSGSEPAVPAFGTGQARKAA